MSIGCGQIDACDGRQAGENAFYVSILTFHPRSLAKLRTLTSAARFSNLATAGSQFRNLATISSPLLPFSPKLHPPKCLSAAPPLSPCTPAAGGDKTHSPQSGSRGVADAALAVVAAASTITGCTHTHALTYLLDELWIMKLCQFCQRNLCAFHQADNILNLHRHTHHTQLNGV